MEEQEQSLTAVEAGVMPIMSVEQAYERYRTVAHFAERILKPDVDYGVIAGANKPALFKAGAEKITTFFGLALELEIIHKIEDWTGQDHGGEPLFHYTARGYLSKNGQVIATADGSCNSWEAKYRYRWVGEHDLPSGVNKASLKRRGGEISEFAFAVDKAETTGKYGKPAEYWQAFKDAIKTKTAVEGRRKTRKGAEFADWTIEGYQYRIPNDDVYSLVNTVLKMAEKRAFVAATLLGTSASEFYTQDVEDFGPRSAAAPPTPSIDLDTERGAVKSLWVALAGQLGLVPLPVDMEGGKKLKAMLGSLYDSLGSAQAGFVQLADKGVAAIINYHIVALKPEPITESEPEQTVETAEELEHADKPGTPRDEDVPPEAQ